MFAESVKGFLDEWQLDGIGMSLALSDLGHFKGALTLIVICAG